MKIFILFFLFLIASSSIRSGEPGFRLQDYRDEIDALLSKLLPVEIADGKNIVVHGPSSETQQQVADRLVQIAGESSQSRSQVIEALIKVLLDPEAMKEWPIAHKWTLAVDMLGDLRAAEAIDVLVQNINRTGENGVISSIHYRPVARALMKIGEPAIPRLIEALGDDEPTIRHKAASTLGEIGRPALAKLEHALSSGNAETKAGAAMALAWMGGEEPKAAIERAIATETDQAILVKLKEALTEMRRVWGK